MIHLKSPEEIERLRVSNELVSKTLAVVGQAIRPGIATKELDKIAYQYIIDNGATPGFLGYGGFPATLCVSVNENVVHGFPSDYILQQGDIISIDCGTIVNGFYGDSAYTFGVGEISEEKKTLLRVTKEALYKGIAEVKLGNRIGDIGFAVQNHAEKHNYGVVRDLVGHAIGRNMHEEPQVPNFGRAGSGVKLQKGMVICIEPMVNMGVKEVVFLSDGWTVKTKDLKPSAHFELCVALDHNGNTDCLSTFKYIEQ